MVSLNRQTNMDNPDAQGPSNSSLPAGEYEVMIANSGIKDTKAGNGKYIYLDLTVVGGPMNGKSEWATFNIMNPNPKAVEIAYQQLDQVAAALGFNFTDTDQIHGRTLKYVKYQKKNSPDLGYRFEAAGAGVAMTPNQGAAPQHQPAQPAQQGSWNQPSQGANATGPANWQQNPNESPF